MDERDLETEEPAPRHAVDQLRARGLKLAERRVQVLRLEGDVMHPRAAPCEEAANGRVVVRRCHELDATDAEEERRCLHSLLPEWLAMLELGAEELLVRRDRLVEVGHREADVVNAACPHAGDAIRGG